MSHFVTSAQARGWQTPVMQRIIAALKEDDDHLREVLRREAQVLWRGPLQLPFEASSPEGKRITFALLLLKGCHPNSVLIQECECRFWKPDADTKLAAEDRVFFDQSPVAADMAVQAAFAASQ